MKPILTILLLILTCSVQADETPDQLRQQFITQMIEQHGFRETEVLEILSAAQVRQPILDAISRPAERVLNWSQYRDIFVTAPRIAGGVEFWTRHAALLERAEREYGVPPQIIVAILGVETRYGANTGNHRVLDALYTLGFHYPRRGPFFREQLSHFLRFAQEEQMDPQLPHGSYAGAMGVPQFMPDSFRIYAVDFDGDGRRDIWHSTADVIGSVANYFVKKGGWKPGEPVAFEASGVTAAHQSLIDAGTRPSLSAEQLANAGITVKGRLIPGSKLSLMDFDTHEGVEHWVGLDNFHAIMRYNPRTKYALAVYQLSEAIREHYLATRG